MKYIRKAINYNELDDIGHGLRTGQPAGIRQAKNASIRNSVGSSGSTGTLTRPAHQSHEHEEAEVVSIQVCFDNFHMLLY